MNVATLITRVRSEVLDDELEPYLWSDTNLINYLNDTIDEVAEDNLVIADQSTAAVAEVRLLSHQTLHPIDDRVLHVRYGRLKTNLTSVIKTTEDWLEANIADWRTTEGDAPTHFAPSASDGYLSIYPRYDTVGEYQGVSNITFTEATRTISQLTGDFSELAVGDQIYVSGIGGNTGFFTVETAGTTSFVVTETLVTGYANTSALIRKVRDTLLMTVNRIQLTPFTVADIASATDITELKSVHHSKLLNGMAKRAFLKPDSETYDKGKAEYHRGLFEVDKKRMKRDIILLNKPDRSRTIRSGTGIGN